MGMSVRALSLALHVPYSRLREIVDGKRGVSADTALRLERYFGSEARGWLALQAAYDLRMAEKLSAKLIQREIEPLATAA
jgi:addiction module HigA family antidote